MNKYLQGGDFVMEESTLISVRKLAALDIALHGQRLIVIEFGLGVFIPAALSLFMVLFGHFGSQLQMVLGVYMMCLALNYAPLFLYAIVIAQRGNARGEVMIELSDPDRYDRKYGFQSLLLLVPIAIPLLAILQELQKRHTP
jgi:hypothetical protein